MCGAYRAAPLWPPVRTWHGRRGSCQPRAYAHAHAHVKAEHAAPLRLAVLNRPCPLAHIASLGVQASRPAYGRSTTSSTTRSSSASSTSAAGPSAKRLRTRRWVGGCAVWALHAPTDPPGRCTALRVAGATVWLVVRKGSSSRAHACSPTGATRRVSPARVSPHVAAAACCSCSARPPGSQLAAAVACRHRALECCMHARACMCCPRACVHAGHAGLLQVQPVQQRHGGRRPLRHGQQHGCVRTLAFPHSTARWRGPAACHAGQRSAALCPA